MELENKPTVAERGSMGGEARAAKLSPEKRRKIAKIAAESRWAGPFPKATHVGELAIADRKIACAVLENGKRVLMQETFLTAIGRAAKAKAGTGSVRLVDGLPPFLAADNLRPFISEELKQSTTPIVFRTPKGNRAFGYDAMLLPKVLQVYTDASIAGALKQNQDHIAKACRILEKGLGGIAIIALVDEATGYQYERARDALAKILEEFIAKELRKWVQTFPPDFYRELFRLRNLKYDGSVKRPQYIGVLTNDLVYARLAPGVLDELRRQTPRDDKGRLKHHLHRKLSEDIGHPKLLQHLSAVTALMKACDKWEQFKPMLDRALPKYRRLPLFDGLEPESQP